MPHIYKRHRIWGDSAVVVNFAVSNATRSEMGVMSKTRITKQVCASRQKHDLAKTLANDDIPMCLSRPMTNPLRNAVFEYDPITR